MENKALGIDYSEDSYKFSSPMASFVYHAYSMIGDSGEEWDSNEASGEWWGRYGRRILVGNSQGFVDLLTYDTVEEAETAAVELYFVEEEEDDYDSGLTFQVSADDPDGPSRLVRHCPQCGGTDHTSVYACEVRQAERLIGTE